MGRIRTVKPELQQQPWFATLTDAAARTYFGLLGVVDDCGRCPADALFIGGQIFWGRQRSAAAIGRQLAELEAAGIIRRYRARGGMYLEVLGWSDKASPMYQQINKPQGERFPAPESFQDGSDSGHESRPETGPDPKGSGMDQDREPIGRSPAHAHAIPPVLEQVTQAHAPAIDRESRSVADRDPKPAASEVRTGYDHRDARARGQLAEAVYRQVSDARVALAAEFGLPAQIPFPTESPSSPSGALRDLQDRIREEGSAAPMVCDRVVANLIAQAREEQRITWVSEKVFGIGPWRQAREWMPGQEDGKRKPATNTPAEIASARKVLERLSEDSGVTWRVEDGNAGPVLARLREGCTELELRAVATDRGDAWRREDKTRHLLTPSIVFGPKFHEYLAIARAHYGDQLEKRDVKS